VVRLQTNRCPYHHGNLPEALLRAAEAVLEGLVSISTDAKFNGVPLETLVPATVKHIPLGLRPR
jgi:hypothetical protein